MEGLPLPVKGPTRPAAGLRAHSRTSSARDRRTPSSTGPRAQSRIGGCLGPFTAQVNPTGGSPGGPPTLPPIGPSCAGRGYHYQQRGPGEHSQARAQNHGVNVQTLPTRRREQMPPPSIPTSPHQKAKKLPFQQHAVSYNPYNPSFPRDKAEKSPSQQHDLSILIVGPNQLKYRLSRTRKPTSHATSNTQCPTTRRWQYRRAAHTATNSSVGRSAPITTGDSRYEKRG